MGVFAVDRGIFDHPIFAPEPYTEREAWLWLISAAAWKATRVRCGRALIELDRGQLAFATRFMAVKWKWAESRVRRFLKRLETDAMVTLSATRETTRITICNYDKYAFGRRTDDAPSDAQTDAPPTHPRRKEEELKNLRTEEDKKEVALRAPVDLSDWPANSFDQFWQKFPHKVGKQAALKAFAKAKRAAPPWQKIISALDRYIASKPPDRAWCNPATWLNEGRWDDEPAANGGLNGQRSYNGNRQSGADAFLAGLAEVAADIGGDGDVAVPVTEEIPRGRFNFDA